MAVLILAFAPTAWCIYLMHTSLNRTTYSKIQYFSTVLDAQLNVESYFNVDFSLQNQYVINVKLKASPEIVDIKISVEFIV